MDLFPLGAGQQRKSMGSTYIQTLKPNVTQQEALRTFSGAGLSTLFWRIRSGPLRRIADVYVPYWLYRVQYNMGRAAHKTLFAIDAVNGSLDLFTFPRIPDAKDLISVQTRNYVAAMAYCAAKDEAAECSMDRTPPTPSSFWPKMACVACRGSDAAHTDR